MSVALSFSYNGLHVKSKGVVLDPMEHLRMLIAAIDCANPKREHSVIVSAISFDPWAMPDEERELAWEVYKRAGLVLSKNAKEGHQSGAATSIRMATEGAAAIGATYLIHLAEDVVPAPDYVDYFLKHLEGHDYVGGYWIMNGPEKRRFSLATQVFGCRVEPFKHLMPFQVTEIEMEMYSQIQQRGLRYKVGATPTNLHAYPEGRVIPYPEGGRGPKLYEHTHDPARFRRLVESRGVCWPEKRPLML